GASRAIAIAKRPRSILLYGLILISITSISSVTCFYFYELFPALNAEFIPISYIIIISIVYVFIYLTLKLISKKIQLKSILKYLPVATFNCAALGSIFLSIHEKFSLWQFISFGLGTAVGFIVASFLVVNGNKRMQKMNPPKAFEGFPLMLIYIGIISMALFCLVGHQLPF
ncbi:MAG: Rnf-Nqr domain containing protein, partial [Clostridia bacterium]